MKYISVFQFLKNNEDFFKPVFHSGEDTTVHGDDRKDVSIRIFLWDCDYY